MTIRVLLAIAVLAAGVWVWRHTTSTAAETCVPGPHSARLCVERPQTTTRKGRT